MDLFSTSQDGKNLDSGQVRSVQSANVPKIVKKLIPDAMRPDRVGQRIMALRETLAMSKAQFADSLELDRSSLTKIEKGTMGLDLVHGAKIAELYGFGMDFVYRGDLSDVPLEHLTRLRMNLNTPAAYFKR